ncbi:MAG: hypothetical protein KGJ13_09430 [Patescibacteria group bacterium]|nr:hypothetical protein [Patescibacteria group bacterium]
MSKIVRKTSSIFASTAGVSQVEQFGAFQSLGSPVFSNDPAVIQALATWALGWSASQYKQVFAPYLEDRNGVDLVNSYQVSYLLAQGIAEWDAATPYFKNSIVSSAGNLYVSLQDNNIGNAIPPTPPNSFWAQLFLPKASQKITETVFTSDSGTYSVPSGVVRLIVSMVGGGGGGAGATSGTGAIGGNPGGATTFGAFTAGGGSGGQPGAEGSGGAGGLGSGISGLFYSLPGQKGGNQAYLENNTAAVNGGQSFFGGVSGRLYQNSAPNTGRGGNAYNGWGGGGGGGAFVKAVFPIPLSASYSYAVGAGGSGGGASNPGFSGGSGIIIIRELYS